ncbi:hypothetical protein [Rhodohalobacter barkolensis]|uniref:Uncharacterized protein n=1 Tax=Rhodohalobacter barkolensis TaxID=2053187 RepID=A0A2N0VIB0_9BACT|nr:hypothetical protein [Rhodohalobacter barkolensis]PKD43930.1 hypothetical protein CWD77_00150 [Rhodohalobacter barkolensis]
MKTEPIVSILTGSVLATAIIFIGLSIMNSVEIALYNFLGSLFAAVSIHLVHYYRKLYDRSGFKNEY